MVLHVLHLIKKISSLLEAGPHDGIYAKESRLVVKIRNSTHNGTVLYICSIEDNSLFKVFSNYNRQNICFSWMHIVVCGHCVKQYIKQCSISNNTRNSDHVCEKFGQIFEKGTRK